MGLFKRKKPMNYVERSASGAVLDITHNDPNVIAFFITGFREHDIHLVENHNHNHGEDEKKHPVGFQRDEGTSDVRSSTAIANPFEGVDDEDDEGEDDSRWRL